MLGLSINNNLHGSGKALWKYGGHDGEDRTVCEFDGTNDLATSGFFDDIEGADGWTLSFWINLPSEPIDSNYFIMQGDSINSNPPFFQLGTGTSGGVRYFKVQDWHANPASGALLDDGDDSIDLGESDHLNRWIHLMFRWHKDYNSGKLQYMIDGCGSFTSTIAASTSVVPALSGSSAEQRLYLAVYFVDAISVHQGVECKMAEVALWPKWLNDEQAVMINSGISPTLIEDDELHHYWPLSGEGEDHGTAARGFLAGQSDEADMTLSGDATFEGTV